MFCPNCGKENPSSARWCAYCGSELITAEMITPAMETAPQMKTKKRVRLWIVLALAVLLIALVLAAAFFARRHGIADQNDIHAEELDRETVSEKSSGKEEEGFAAPAVSPSASDEAPSSGSLSAEPQPAAESSSAATDDPSAASASEPAAVQGEIVAMTAEQQFNANIFLSNFSEQHAFEKNGFDAADPNWLDLIQFAFLWCKINNRDALTVAQINDEYFHTITLGNANQPLDRYFGIRLTDAQASQMHPDPAGNGFYRGYLAPEFYFLAADGEAYNHLSVVRQIENLPDGTVRLSFDIYTLDIMAYWEKGGVDRSWYGLTAAQAVEEPALMPDLSGEAIVVNATRVEGEENWHLIRYSTWDYGLTGTVASITRGSVSGKSYTNPFLGIRFTAPEDWSYRSDCQLAGQNGISCTLITDEKMMELLDQNGMFFEMAAFAPDNTNISILYERLSPLAAAVTEKGYFSANRDATVSSLEKIGLKDVTFDISEADLAGETHGCAEIRGRYKDGSLFYQKQIAVLKGEYIVLVTGASSDEQLITELMDTFIRIS